MIRVEKIFAYATVLEKGRDPVNKIISIEKISVLETGSIQPRSLNEKIIVIKKEENGKFVEEIKFEITLLPLKEML